MLRTIRFHSVVDERGNIQLPSMPELAGKEVEITILVHDALENQERYPLRGTEYRFDDSFTPPVVPED